MKYVYSLQVEGYSSKFSLYLNECRVFNNSTEDAIFFDLPVNEWLSEGKNQVRIEIHSSGERKDSQNSGRLEVAITRRMTGTSKLNAPRIATISFEENKKETNDLSSLPRIGFFMVEEPIHNSFYDNLIDISDISAGEVYEYYQMLFQVFKEKQMARFLELISFKVNEFSNAYSVSREKEIERQREFFERFYTTRYFILPFERVFSKFIFSTKLVTMEDDEQDQPIYFFDKENELVLSYPVYLGKKRGESELSIIR